MIYKLLAVVILGALGGCIAMPGGTVVDPALVVHTAGSSRSTVSVRVPRPAEDVWSVFDDVVASRADVTSVERNERARMLEVTGEFGEITAQVTPLGSSESLLYVWVDAAGTGRPGEEVAIRSVEAICDRLGVPYERVQY